MQSTYSTRSSTCWDGVNPEYARIVTVRGPCATSPPSLMPATPHVKSDRPHHRFGVLDKPLWLVILGGNRSRLGEIAGGQ